MLVFDTINILFRKWVWYFQSCVYKIYLFILELIQFTYFQISDFLSSSLSFHIDQKELKSLRHMYGIVKQWRIHICALIYI